MSQAKTGDSVKIHYTGKLENGTEFDSSSGRDPLEFKLGEGTIIPGLEQAIVGMDAGESKSVSIAPEQAYGERHEQLVQEVPKSALPEEIEPSVGMQLQSKTPDGQMMPLTVTAVTEEAITVDGNHPLAGQKLEFDIELVEIK